MRLKKFVGKSMNLLDHIFTSKPKREKLFSNNVLSSSLIENEDEHYIPS